MQGLLEHVSCIVLPAGVNRRDHTETGSDIGTLGQSPLNGTQVFPMHDEPFPGRGQFGKPAQGCVEACVETGSMTSDCLMSRPRSTEEARRRPALHTRAASQPTARAGSLTRSRVPLAKSAGTQTLRRGGSCSRMSI